MAAVAALLQGISDPCCFAIAIALHRSPSAPQGSLVHALQRHIVRPVREVNDKDAIESGIVYLAPADYHLLVERDHFALSIDAPVRFSRPSIDVLFETAADAF